MSETGAKRKKPARGTKAREHIKTARELLEPHFGCSMPGTHEWALSTAHAHIATVEAVCEIVSQNSDAAQKALANARKHTAPYFGNSTPGVTDYQAASVYAQIALVELLLEMLPPDQTASVRKLLKQANNRVHMHQKSLALTQIAMAETLAIYIESKKG